MVYMAKNTEENRVVKIKNMVQPSSSKWAGIPMDEEGKKRFRQTWKEIDSCLKILKKTY